MSDSIMSGVLARNLVAFAVTALKCVPWFRFTAAIIKYNVSFANDPRSDKYLIPCHKAAAGACLGTFPAPPGNIAVGRCRSGTLPSNLSGSQSSGSFTE
ncbi:hypothetical protein MY10362_006192 [Beauveria mimosiformis]